MRPVSYFIKIMFFLLLQSSANGQPDSAKNKLQFRAGVYYISNIHYYGRTDSLQSNAVFPLAELWFRNRFYINAAPVFLNNSKQKMQYAGGVTTAGYQVNDKKKWAGNFYITKPFYRENSELVQAALKAQVSATLTLKTRVVNLTGGGDIKFSGKTDFGAMAELDHVFRFALPGNLVIVVNPSASVNAGTRQFAHTYYKNNGFLLFPGTEQAVTETVQKFNILSYEFSVPVVFAKGKFQLLLIPAYVIPENLIMVAGRPDLSERGKKLLYTTLGAKVIF